MIEQQQAGGKAKQFHLLIRDQEIRDQEIREDTSHPRLLMRVLVPRLVRHRHHHPC